ncbi:MAG: hypothetical protein HOC20_01395 [Chloroflexi bacterium]|jgi:hypothetical protein|nr:hypothetical protein [Chloroflexota bacterium]
MDEMKSALERALERADRMGRLSPEELQRQNEGRYIQAGEAITQRFFEHGNTSILAEQIEKLESGGTAIAIRSALATLIGGMDLSNKDLTERTLDGINSLGGSKPVNEISEEIMSLFGQYAWQKKLWYEENAEEAGKEIKERMASAGIYGSAIAEINIENNEEWAQKSDELRSEFNSRLSEMKKVLGQALYSE